MAKKGKLKQHHQKGESKRPLRLKKYAQFFLIVCENEKTEPLFRNEIYAKLQSQIRKSAEKDNDYEYDHYKSNNIVEIINVWQ